MTDLKQIEVDFWKNAFEELTAESSKQYVELVMLKCRVAGLEVQVEHLDSRNKELFEECNKLTQENDVLIDQAERNRVA